MANEVIRLENAQTRDLLLLDSRGPGVYRKKLLIEGNSLLSTVWVNSIDPGASVEVRYYDVTSGRDLGEEGTLPSHPAITSATTDHNKITVTPFHNNPVMEATVTGGNVKFSVWGTVVSSFATDIGQALVFDGTTFVSDQIKAMPVACLDRDTNTLHFLSCTDGAISTSATPQITNRYYATDTVNAGGSSTLINQILIRDETVNQIMVGGNGSGEFTIKINSIVWGVLRNSWDKRQVILPLGGKQLVAGDTITVEVDNIALGNQAAIYEAFIFVGD